MHNHPSFKDRYVVIIITSKSDMSLHLYDTKQQVSWEDRALVTRQALSELLTRGDVLSDSTRAFIEYLTNNDTWSITFDAYSALELAEKAGLRIYASYYGSEYQLQIDRSSPTPLKMSVTREIGNMSQFEVEVTASGNHVRKHAQSA